MCIFCKIIAGEIPSHKLYEDSDTLAFLDIEQDYVGHALVIPKQHVCNILDCHQDVLHAVFNTVQRISKHFIDNCGFDGVSYVSNNGEGQEVMHLHVHLIPRTSKAPIVLCNKPPKIDRDFKNEQARFKL